MISPRVILVAAAILGFAFGAAAQTTNSLSEAEIQGRALAQKILDLRPTENSTNFGVLRIHTPSGMNTNIPIKFVVAVTSTNWIVCYIFGNDAHSYSSGFYFATNSSHLEILDISHVDSLSNRYSHDNVWSMWMAARGLPVDGSAPIAGSDFWGIDLGLEFFHWPQQKILKKEFHRQCACMVLESTNLNPTTNGYSRVVSWIDEESLGIVEAYAYDAKGKKLKNFYPKDFEKVNGQYQVQSLIMDNLQTGSRSRLEFDLKK